jgi:hypothetical protein
MTTRNTETERKIEMGDVVQITNQDHHWFGCLIVVSEPKTFGCQGYISIPHDNVGDVRDAHIRLNTEDFEYVGHAVLTRE